MKIDKVITPELPAQPEDPEVAQWIAWLQATYEALKAMDERQRAAALVYLNSRFKEGR